MKDINQNFEGVKNDLFVEREREIAFTYLSPNKSGIQP